MPEGENVLTAEKEADCLEGSATAILGLAGRGVPSGQEAGPKERSHRYRVFVYTHGGCGQGLAVI